MRRNCGLRIIANFGLLVAYFGLKITDLGLWIAGCVIKDVESKRTLEL